MKKLAITIILIMTSVAGYIYADANKPIKMKTTEGSECENCHMGHYMKSNQGVIFELSERGIEPVFDAEFLKCDHCQILLQTKEFKNGYFSIPAPK
jgi:hypothetical protein